MSETCQTNRLCLAGPGTTMLPTVGGSLRSSPHRMVSKFEVQPVVPVSAACEQIFGVGKDVFSAKSEPDV